MIPINYTIAFTTNIIYQICQDMNGNEMIVSGQQFSCFPPKQDLLNSMGCNLELSQDSKPTDVPFKVSVTQK